ncbi:hypothetical protein [Cupriavidus pauculus]|uniref:hypothetical protein n=1 Tax=Cupriavidus pauculus TaxID=82633 RepID=UPI000A068502|nr:hypothetical protein [Cupriavidus pauculus]
MAQKHLPPSTTYMDRSHVPTEEAAHLLMVQPQTIRKQVSQTGTYLSIRPQRLPNRRLAWPLDEIKQLLNGGAS